MQEALWKVLPEARRDWEGWLGGHSGEELRHHPPVTLLTGPHSLLLSPKLPASLAAGKESVTLNLQEVLRTSVTNKTEAVTQGPESLARGQQSTVVFVSRLGRSVIVPEKSLISPITSQSPQMARI